MKKLKNSAMLVVAALCGYLALMTPDWKSELSAMSGVGYLPNNDYNELSGSVSDVLMRSTSTGSYSLYEVNNYNVVGTTTPALNTSSDYVYQCTVEVGDGSGDVEVITRRTSDGGWSYFRISDRAVIGSGDLTGMPTSSALAYVATGDIDADGDDDILVRNTGTGVYTAFMMQNGLFNNTSAYNTFTGAAMVPQGMADLDSDGDDELIMRNSSTGLWYVAQTENGLVQSNVNLGGVYASNQYVYAFATDLNGDGYDDIALRKMNIADATQGLWVQFQYGRNTPGDVRFVVKTATNLNLFYNPTMITLGAIGDYNGDGRTDVILRDTRNYWWLSQMGVGGAVGSQLFIYINSDPDYTIQQSID